MAQPRISVVVCTRNRPQLIVQTIESILSNVSEEAELLVVDQSTDDLTSIALELFRARPRFRYLHTSTVGLSRARNIGICNTLGEIVAFTDDDCVVSNDWLQQIMACFAQHSQVSLIFGAVLPPNDYRPERGFVPVYAPENGVWHRDNLHWHACGMGANMSIRRTLVHHIGYFDSQLGPGAEFLAADDTDYALRAIDAGELIVTSRFPKVIHAGGVRSNDAQFRLWQSYGYSEGGLLVKLAKHRRWLMIKARLQMQLEWSVELMAGLARLRRPTHMRQFIYYQTALLRGMCAGIRHITRIDESPSMPVVLR